jgi:hypothetical protein
MHGPREARADLGRASALRLPGAEGTSSLRELA